MDRSISSLDNGESVIFFKFFDTVDQKIILRNIFHHGMRGLEASCVDVNNMIAYL